MQASMSGIDHNNQTKRPFVPLSVSTKSTHSNVNDKRDEVVTSTLGNTAGGLAHTVGGVVGAASRGVGETVTAATGGLGKPLGDGVANIGTGVEGGVGSVAKGVKDAGEWKTNPE
jgi:hypothetical protein